MLKLIPAIALAAMLLSPTLASAAVAGPGAGPSHQRRKHRHRSRDDGPAAHAAAHSVASELLNCHTYERRNPYNDTVVTRTICK